MTNGETVKEELDLMIKSFDEGLPEPTRAPGTNAPGTQAPATQAPETQAPATQAPATQAPVTAVPDDKDQVIEDLRAKLAEKEEKKAPKSEAPTTQAPITFEEQDFIGEMDLDELSRDPKEFNKTLNKIYQKAVEDARKMLGDNLQSIPDLVRNNVTMMESLKEAGRKFYEDNADLEPFKKVVGAVFEEMMTENPDKKYDEIMKDVAPEVRKRLELPEKAVSKDKPNRGNPPKLPRKGGKGGKPQDKPSVDPLQAQLEEMNRTLGR